MDLTGRKSRGINARPYILYPDDKFKTRWDIVLTMYDLLSILFDYSFIVLTCVLGPWSLAFPDSYSGFPVYLDYLMNIFFGFDLILNFFCAYLDTDFQIVDDYKVTIKAHIKYSRLLLAI